MTKLLIGFCGAPWTVALYAIEGRGGTDKSSARSWAYTKPALLEKACWICLVEGIRAISGHEQVKAGADALMIFESWAEGLPSRFVPDFGGRNRMRLW